MATGHSDSEDSQIKLLPVLCVSCKENNDVDSYCVSCHEECCNICKIGTHENHNTLPRGHPIAVHFRLCTQDYDFCRSHKDDKITMYCNTCNVPCCSTCLDEIHDEHSLSTVRSAVKKAEALFGKLTEVLPEARSSFDVIKVEYDSYEETTTEVITGIKGRFRNLHEALNKMETEMLEPLNNERELATKLIDERKRVINEVECLSELYKSAVEEETNIRKLVFLAICPDLEILKTESDAIPEPFHYEAKEYTFPATEDMIGVVSKTDGKSVCERDSDSADINDFDFTVEVDTLKTIESLRLNGKVVHTTAGETWHITYHYKKGEYSLFSLYDNTQEISNSRRFSFDVFDVTLAPPSRLFFTTRVMALVYTLDSSGDLKCVINTAPVVPTGICFTSDGKLALGLHDTNEKRHLIRLYTIQMKLRGEIENDENGKPLFSYIKSITENSHGEYIVDESSHLLCISKHGSLKWKLKKDFSFYCCDKLSNIVIATETEIKLVSRDGEYIRTLLKRMDFLSKPTSLSIDSDDLLWVGQDNGTKVVKYLK